MSTYLAAWAILPETYGRRADNEDEPVVSGRGTEILLTIINVHSSLPLGLDVNQREKIKLL